MVRITETLSYRIRQACQKNELYDIFKGECGPFDGGCVMVAEALRQALGQGELYGAYGRRVGTSAIPDWGHAVLRVGPDQYLDGNGLQTEEQLGAYWRENERYVITFLAKMKKALKDYDSAYDPEGVRKLVDYFRRELKL